MKTRQFSIFLLKEKHNATNALKIDNNLIKGYRANNLPQSSVLYIADNIKTTPWWVDYFDIGKELKQENKGALIFMKIKTRWFVLSFGHAYHNLDDNSYEYDFGLKVTLNSLQPNELKSADIVNPGASRKKRMQAPVASDLTYLDFDSNSEILKSLTGKVKDEHKNLFKNATGSTSLKVDLKIKPDELEGLCEKLLDLYKSQEYLKTFPNIHKISPEIDPSRIRELDDKLLKSIKSKSLDLDLSIPEIIDYHDKSHFIFRGVSSMKKIHTEMDIKHLYDYLGDEYVEKLTIEKLKNLSIALCNTEGSTKESFSIYRCITFDSQLKGDNLAYHLCDGGWYKIQSDYLSLIKSVIDKKCEDTTLPPYDHDNKKQGAYLYSEENYNADVAQKNNAILCLDQTNISPAGETQIEPCDLFSLDEQEKKCILYHIKISSRSSQLSHLFNQGYNSLEALSLEEKCREKLKKLITDKLSIDVLRNAQSAIDQRNYKVIFGIITRKNKDLKSQNLPLFSRISLMRVLRALELSKTDASIVFIKDNSPIKEAFLTNTYIEVIVKEKKEVYPSNDQHYPVTTKIKRCHKDIRESPVGSKFKIYVKEDGNKIPTSSHHWTYEKVLI